MNKDLYKTFLHNYSNYIKFKEHKFFNYNGNTPLSQNIIPKETTHLIFDGNFNEPLNTCYFPKSIYSITFSYSSRFYKPINKNDLPEHITELIFENQYDERLYADNLPSNLEKIVLSDCYDHPLTNTFPKNIKSIYIGTLFNNKINIGDFPYGVTKICFGPEYKRRLSSGVIPNTVTELFFNKYNHSLKNIIPNSVIIFGIGKCKKLKIGDLPNSIEELYLNYCFNKELYYGIIPNSVKKLHIYGNIKNLNNKYIFPSSIQFLHIDDIIIESYGINILNYIFSNNKLDNLLIFEAESNNNWFSDIDELPTSIVILKLINGVFNYDVKKITNLQEVIISNSFLSSLLLENLTLNKNINYIVSRQYDDCFIRYDFMKLKINIGFKEKINDLIINNFKKEKLISNIIKDELLAVCYSPNRLKHFSNEFDNYIF